MVVKTLKQQFKSMTLEQHNKYKELAKERNTNYKGIKFSFTNGNIKNDFFSYRLFFINDIGYLFEIY